MTLPQTTGTVGDTDAGKDRARGLPLVPLAYKYQGTNGGSDRDS